MDEEKGFGDGPCENCGEPGYECIDPYAAEIGGIENEVILCDSCYAERCADI
mgnify:CR=1 FL=1